MRAVPQHILIDLIVNDVTRPVKRNFQHLHRLEEAPEALVFRCIALLHQQLIKLLAFRILRQLRLQANLQARLMQRIADKVNELRLLGTFEEKE